MIVIQCTTYAAFMYNKQCKLPRIHYQQFQINMSIIASKMFLVNAMPVAPQAMSSWVISRSLMEEDFSPEDDSTTVSVTDLPPASVLAVITVEPVTARVIGSRWCVSGTLGNALKFRAAKIFSGVEDSSVSFQVKLPSLMMFKFPSTGQHRNFSQWLSWETVFNHGSIHLRNKKGDIHAKDKEAILAHCPSASSGMLFRLVVIPKSVGNMVLTVNVVPGSIEDLHKRCRDQGLETTFIHHPVYKPCLSSNNNSMVVPYARVEKPTQKFCLVHIPVIEILTEDDDSRSLPQSSALRQELFTLHR